MRWQWRHDDDAELMWHLHVDVALEAGVVWVGMRLALRPLGHRLLPLRFDVSPPTLVRAVVDGVEVAEDGWPLTREPAYAVDDDGVRALAELLVDPDRLLPVFVISPAEVYDERDDVYREEPVVDPDAIAEALVGLAHVAVVETTALTYKLTDLVGRELSVFGGAVRLYWPGRRSSSGPGRGSTGCKRRTPSWPASWPWPTRTSRPSAGTVSTSAATRVAPLPWVPTWCSVGAPPPAAAVSTSTSTRRSSCSWSATSATT